MPKNITKHTRWKVPYGYDEVAYEKALYAYNAAIQRRPSQPPKPPVDCAMILWADTTSTVPMPMVKPDPNVDLKTPVLTPDRDCTPPASMKRLPDSLRAPLSPPKKYPLRFPRK